LSSFIMLWKLFEMIIITRHSESSYATNYIDINEFICSKLHFGIY